MRTYPDIDPETLGVHYEKHIVAMTVERLERKADIATQLALRDQEIERLRDTIALIGTESAADGDYYSEEADDIAQSRSHAAPPSAQQATESSALLSLVAEVVEARHMNQEHLARLRAFVESSAQQATGSGQVLMDAMREIEERTRPNGDMADRPVNELAREALAAATQAQPKTRSQKLAEAGYTRRPSAKCLPSDDDPEETTTGTQAQPEPREQRLAAAMKRLDKEGTLPGMISAFEQQFGQTWTDRDWRNETSVWACAWRAALAAPTTGKREPLTDEQIYNLDWPADVGGFDDVRRIVKQVEAAHGITGEQR